MGLAWLFVTLVLGFASSRVSLRCRQPKGSARLGVSVDRECRMPKSSKTKGRH